MISTELVNDCPIKNGDIVLTTEEVERYDSKVLRRMAAEANTDEISGRSVAYEWASYFGRQYTLKDFE